MEIYKKLFSARDYIKNNPMKKEGRNKYSEYDYFTPSQISNLVHNAEKENGLIHLYDLQKKENGFVANLLIVNIDEPNEKLNFSIPTSIPDIKATNEAQRLGGAVTYSERYLLQIAFDIFDNNIDFDNLNKPQEKLKEIPEISEKLKEIPIISEKFIKNWNKENPVDGVVILSGKKYKLSKLAEQQLDDYIAREIDSKIREIDAKDYIKNNLSIINNK